MDQETVQWLNLVHMNQTFVVRVGTPDEKASVQSPDMIPNRDGEYWVAGKTFLNSGMNVESVFRVDTDAAGALIGAFWHIANECWDFQNCPGVFEALGVEEAEAFPFEWSCSVPLEKGLYHS